jgi:F420 biosynthesis protein FbiB-like protein
MKKAISADSIHNFMRSRRSVRRFLPMPVPRDLIDRIIETATWSPSAHNRQPWRFVLLLEESTKRRLVEEMSLRFRRDLLTERYEPEEVERLVARSQRRILGAPVIILLCLDISILDMYSDKDRQNAEYLMGVQSVAIAGGNLLLAAHAEGLGGVWVCAPIYVRDVVQRTLDLSPSWEPQSMLLLGYPEVIPEPRPRQSINEITRIV